VNTDDETSANTDEEDELMELQQERIKAKLEV
jgi:hypothetical protein